MTKKIKEDKAEMFTSLPCLCADKCNKGLTLIRFANDKNALEVGIDWRISSKKPLPEDNGVSVIVNRNYLLENILKSGEGLMKSVEFEIELDKYLAEFLSKGKPNIKLPTEITMDEFQKWLKIKVKKDYAEFDK